MKSISYELLINKGRQISDGLVEQELVERSAIPSTNIAWHSYVQRFLKNRSIVSRKPHGESGDADSASAQHFPEHIWPGIFASVGHDPGRVFNTDGTGLFWRGLPQQTLARADERLQGGKTQKDRVTFAITNGRYETPSPCDWSICSSGGGGGGEWESNAKAWMNSKIF